MFKDPHHCSSTPSVAESGRFQMCARVEPSNATFDRAIVLWEVGLRQERSNVNLSRSVAQPERA